MYEDKLKCLSPFLNLRMHMKIVDGSMSININMEDGAIQFAVRISVAKQMCLIFLFLHEKKYYDSVINAVMNW